MASTSNGCGARSGLKASSELRLGERGRKERSQSCRGRGKRRCAGGFTETNSRLASLAPELVGQGQRWPPSKDAEGKELTSLSALEEGETVQWCPSPQQRRGPAIPTNGRGWREPGGVSGLENFSRGRSEATKSIGREGCREQETNSVSVRRWVLARTYGGEPLLWVVPLEFRYPRARKGTSCKSARGASENEAQ